MKAGALREGGSRDRRSGFLAGKQRDERHTQLTGKKKGLEHETRNKEDIKQGSAGRDSSVVICKKYLSKEHSPLKPGREPEFPVLPC